MKLLELTDKAYEQYQQQVRGNSTIAFDQAEKKLNRNIQLVKEFASQDIQHKGFFKVTFPYGNLEITTRFNKIINIENHKGRPTDWHINWQRYEQLSKQLGIIDYKKRSKIKRKSS